MDKQPVIYFIQIYIYLHWQIRIGGGEEVYVDERICLMKKKKLSKKTKLEHHQEWKLITSEPTVTRDEKYKNNV